MSGSLGIEEGDATIVEVEGDGDALTTAYSAPGIRAMADVLDHKYGIRAAAVEQLANAGRSGGEDEGRRVSGRELMANDGLAASCPEVFIVAQQINYRPGLQVVGQAEIQPSQLTTQGAVIESCLPISIVWPMLIDHISHKAIVGGRLYAETPTVAYAPQPYPCLMQMVHQRADKTVTSPTTRRRLPTYRG